MTRELIVPDRSAEERLDKFIADASEDVSRSVIKRLIASGDVTVDGEVEKASLRLKAGQLVSIAYVEPEPSYLEPQDIHVDVLYEDADVIVVNKPAGLTVHPAPGHPDGTLVNAILAMCPDLQDIGGTIRPGIVHRLDKDTSGVMVVAKNGAAHADVSAQIKDRNVSKKYLALVTGRLEPSRAIIDAPIGRDNSDRKRMAITEKGRDAITRYSVLKYYAKHSYVNVEIETGRTHQIRVHFASIGSPVAGDVIYGRPHVGLERQFIHAHKLGFTVPSTGEFTEFTAELPQDLQAFLDQIES